MGVVPHKEQRECCWMEVRSPDQAAFYTILLIENIAINLKKKVKTIGFKRHHYFLLKNIIESNKLEGRVVIEEKFKIVKTGKKLDFIPPN